MNKKNSEEAKILSRAKDEDYLAELSAIRRPYNLSKLIADFVSTDSTGSKVEIDIKAIDGNRQRSYYQQTKNIIKNIKEKFEVADDPNKVQMICNISAVPTFLQKTIFNNITKGLDSNQLKKVNFLFN